MRYTVKDVVCDYGVYEGDTLVVIANSRKNAEIIAQILNYDWDFPNTARAITQDMLLDFWRGARYEPRTVARFAKDTMNDDHICPYCGSANIDWRGGGYRQDESEAHYQCNECGECYYVSYDESSWDNDCVYFNKINGVTDRHRRSLI